MRPDRAMSRGKRAQKSLALFADLPIAPLPHTAVLRKRLDQPRQQAGSAQPHARFVAGRVIADVGDLVVFGGIVLAGQLFPQRQNFLVDYLTR